MVRFLTTVGGIAVGAGIALGVVALAAHLMGPPAEPQWYGCKGMDGSTYKTTEAQLKVNRPMLKLIGSVNGEELRVFVPAISLMGCVEI